ncbi:MAG TPA: hypothetical protein DDZ51_28380, partial [Planctomycetaceae bacterium]|nr:hypothetical protein [Planctomycetaceae bacterium]
MTSYPAPPPTSGAPLASSPAANNTSNHAPPELPSAAWPWLVSIVAIVALGLQTWALLGLLSAGRLESDFQAKVVAWETANKNRQEAINTWNSIEKQVNANVDQLREQASLLQGTI